MKELLYYTRKPVNEFLYDPKLAYSMHLAIAEGNSFQPFNHNSGILFALATENEDGSLNPKSLKAPCLFRKKDGAFGVLAIRTEGDGEFDSESCGAVVYFTSTNLTEYEERGLIRLSDECIEAVHCEFISEDDLYRIYWKKDGSDEWYMCEVPSLELIISSNTSEPFSGSVPILMSSLSQAFFDSRTLPEGAVPHGIIKISDKLAEHLMMKLQVPKHIRTEFPEEIRVHSESELSLLRAALTYSDGTTESRQIDWNMNSIDFDRPGSYQLHGKLHQEHFSFPIAENRADPCITFRNGKYYYIATNDADGNHSLYVREADSMAALVSAEEHLILDTNTYDYVGGLLWAPEFHEVNGRLYIFMALTPGEFFCEESHLLELRAGGNPACREDWSAPKRIVRADGSELCEMGKVITLDMTCFEWEGEYYVIWSQRQFLPKDLGAWLFIAKLNPAEPWKLLSEPVLLSKPDYGWANNHTFVDEGPFAIIRESQLIVTFSSAAVDSSYVVGILTLKKGSSPLIRSSWRKGNYPILTSRSVEGEFGTGHNAYVTDEYGELWNTYHARPGVSGARSSGIRRVHFDPDDMPRLDLTEELDLTAGLDNISCKVIVDSDYALLTPALFSTAGLCQVLNAISLKKGTISELHILLDGSRMNDGDYAGISLSPCGINGIAFTKNKEFYYITSFPGKSAAGQNAVNIRTTVSRITLCISIDFTDATPVYSFSYIQNHDGQDFENSVLFAEYENISCCSKTECVICFCTCSSFAQTGSVLIEDYSYKIYHKQGLNPYLPSWEYIPDGEPYVFGNRIYIYGSHDRFDGHVFCTGDYVCWSAPVSNPGAWHYEGIIYPRTADPANQDGKMCLYAPDVTLGSDGRYYLYYVLDKCSVVSVAVSETPAGQYRFYGYVRYSDGTLLGERSGDEPQFDPGVLTEGTRTYLYTGFCSPSDSSRHGAMATVLGPDMLTIENDPVFVIPNAVYGKGTGFEGHEFFEAPSIRKFNGLYYLIYSSVAMHELCYATSLNPLKGFTYGGVIISNCDLHIDSYKPADQPMAYGANNHGSIVQINQNRYIFYHRHTNGTWYSRQGCAEKLLFHKDGSIEQAELTSCGLNSGPLEGVGYYPAYLACNLFTDQRSVYVGGDFPKIIQDGDDGNRVDGYIHGMTDSSTAGFKYFSCNHLCRVTVISRGYGGGLFEIRSSWDGPVLASIRIHFTDVWEHYPADITFPDGINALYITYRGGGSVDFKGFLLA